MNENRELPVQWADRAMFEAETFDEHQWDERYGVVPRVSLIWMTPDPLGALASYNEMYEGRVIRSMDDVTDEMRRKALENIQKTHLQAPLENLKVQFLFEGVDRAITHQVVRQRTAVFAQESMRFAVKDDLRHSTSLPPSLFGTTETEVDFDYGGKMLDHKFDRQEMRWRAKWDLALDYINRVYGELVNDGMPAEDARGLLPHCTATRMHMTTDMRNLIAHAGNRLCTQAQFPWRSIFTQIVMGIRSHSDGTVANDWQFAAIADSGMFRPACYQLGHCPFKASFDRACSIRDRVDAFADAGVPSSEWHDRDHFMDPILPQEWAMDPAAARKPV